MTRVQASYVKKKVQILNMKYHSLYFLNYEILVVFKQNVLTYDNTFQIYGNAQVDIYCFKRPATSYFARQKLTLELRDIVKMKAGAEN